MTTRRVFRRICSGSTTTGLQLRAGSDRAATIHMHQHLATTRGQVGAARAAGGVFKVVDVAVRQPRFDDRLAAPVGRLLDCLCKACDCLVRVDGALGDISTRKGVILAFCGFESAPDLQRTLLPIELILSHPAQRAAATSATAFSS